MRFDIASIACSSQHWRKSGGLKKVWNFERINVERAPGVSMYIDTTERFEILKQRPPHVLNGTAGTLYVVTNVDNEKNRQDSGYWTAMY